MFREVVEWKGAVLVTINALWLFLVGGRCGWSDVELGRINAQGRIDLVAGRGRLHGAERKLCRQSAGRMSDAIPAVDKCSVFEKLCSQLELRNRR